MFDVVTQDDIAGGQSGALTRALGAMSGDGRPLSLSLQILLLMSLLTVLPSRRRSPARGSPCPR